MSFADILKSLDKSAAKKLVDKLPSWEGVDIEVPKDLNLQQCSSESTALYKASLLPAGARVADLTGGLGADSWAFSRRASAVWYNERDLVLLEAVRRNFAALGLDNVSFSCYDVSEASDDWKEALAPFRPDVIYLDPARRDAAGRKVFLLEDCSPDVVALMPHLLEIAPEVMVKLSPMADITMLRKRLYRWLSELHVVGADGECKELLCLCRREFASAGTEGPATSILAAAPLRLSNAGPTVPADERKRGAVSKIVLAEDGSVFTTQKWPPKDYASLIPPTAETAGPSHLSEMLFPPIVPQGTSAHRGGHGRPRSSEATSASVLPELSSDLLFVPSAAMVKSGLGPGICIMTYDEQLSHFGKFWRIIENLPFASSVLKDLGRRYPKAEVTARGVPMSSEELRSRLRVKPGGTVHIFACTISGSRRLIISKEI